MKKVLMAATVAPMIGQFNMDNINILRDMGYVVDVAADFKEESVWPRERVLELAKTIRELGGKTYEIEFSRNPLRINKHIQSFFKTLHLLKKGEYDFVHTHTPIASAIIRLAAKITGTKVVYTAHGFHFYKGAPKRNWIIYYPMEWFLSRFTDLLITINAEDYRRAKNFHAHSLKYIHGVGIDVDSLGKKEIDINSKRKELGIDADKKVLLSVGELSDRKNHEVVIRALAKIHRDDIEYFIAGHGELEKYLTYLSKKLGVGDRVHLIGFRNDIPQLCKAADVFVFSSHQEGLPVALMEAIACKTFVICSRIRGNTDLIKNKDVLFDQNNVDEVARSIEYGLRCNKEDLVEENYNRLLKFDIKNVNKEMRKIYKSMQK